MSVVTRSETRVEYGRSGSISLSDMSHQPIRPISVQAASGNRDIRFRGRRDVYKVIMRGSGPSVLAISGVVSSQVALLNFLDIITCGAPTHHE